MENSQSDPLRKLVVAFEAALSEGPEEVIQLFLEKHHLLLDTLSNNSEILTIPKLQLGSEYVTDFVLLHGTPAYSNVGRPRVTFIELERADRPLFTKSGDPSALLTHAVRQIQDWKGWIESNRDYAGRLLTSAAEKSIAQLSEVEEKLFKSPRNWGRDIDQIPHLLSLGFNVKYVVIAGRRTQMSMVHRLRLERMNEDLADIEILTFDELLDRFLHRLRWLKNNGEQYFGPPWLSA